MEISDQVLIGANFLFTFTFLNADPERNGETTSIEDEKPRTSD